MRAQKILYKQEFRKTELALSLSETACYSVFQHVRDVIFEVFKASAEPFRIGFGHASSHELLLEGSSCLSHPVAKGDIHPEEIQGHACQVRRRLEHCRHD